MSESETFGSPVSPFLYNTFKTFSGKKILKAKRGNYKRNTQNRQGQAENTVFRSGENSP